MAPRCTRSRSSPRSPDTSPCASQSAPPPSYHPLTKVVLGEFLAFFVCNVVVGVSLVVLPHLLALGTPDGSHGLQQLDHVLILELHEDLLAHQKLGVTERYTHLLLYELLAALRVRTPHAAALGQLPRVPRKLTGRSGSSGPPCTPGADTPASSRCRPGS